MNLVLVFSASNPPVSQATLTFFDTTPLGRILNRFSSDLYIVDDSLPFNLNIMLATVFGMLGLLVVICYGLPWVLVPLVPLALLYYRIQHYYRHTSRELKRLCSLTLSPVYSHFSETVTGLGTIRASASSARSEEQQSLLRSSVLGSLKDVWFQIRGGERAASGAEPEVSVSQQRRHAVAADPAAAAGRRRGDQPGGDRRPPAPAQLRGPG